MPQVAEVKANRFKEFSAKVRVVDASEEANVDVVAVVTCDSVDADEEVVLPGGADLSRYIKAPRIQLCHAYGKPGEYYPLPVGKALWTKREGRTLMQGIRFAKTEMGQEVAELFRDGMMNTFSIGFISLEASPPTKAEIVARPEWKDAKLIHRKWQLLEVSAVPIPSNENAIGEWVRKGHRIPKFLIVKGGRSVAKKSGDPVPEPHDTATDKPTDHDPGREPHDFTPGDHVEVDKAMGGGCGSVKSVHGEGEDLPDDAEDMTDGHRPAAKVEMHDAEHKCTGVMKCFGRKSMAMVATEHKAVTDATLKIGDKIIVHSMAGGGFGIIKSIHKGTVTNVDEDFTDGSEDPAAKVAIIDADGRDTGKTIGALAKHLALINDKSYYGSPWMGEEAEKGNAYRIMAQGLIDRHKKIMRTQKAGHLYARQDKMEAHYVRHKSDDDDTKGYHTAEQCKAMLGEAPGCKAVTVDVDHPPDEDAWEMLHPAPPSHDMWFARSIKAMNEASGTEGGYTLAPETRVDHSGEDDFLEEETPTYMPKPREVVQWEDHEGMHAGAGRVKSIHMSGKAVPDVMNECIGTKEVPHARINLFKKGEDGDYTETEHHVGVKCKMCKRMPILSVSAKTVQAPVVERKEAPARTEPAPEGPTLKRIPKVQTEEQFQAEMYQTLKSRESAPEFKQKAIDEAVRQYIGGV